MYDAIDPTRIRVRPLAERRSFIEIEQAAINPAAPPPDAGPLAGMLDELARRIAAARARGASTMLAYGAHLIKNGAGPLLAALCREGFITHLATQGAGVIHDWEFAYLGRSSESVRDNAPRGEFGSWDETGRFLNLAALVGAADGIGWGEAMGRMVATESLNLPDPDSLRRAIVAAPDDERTAARADLLHVMRQFDLPAGRMAVPHTWRRYSALAAAYEASVPLTVHPGIGYDIIVNHPLFHGGAVGRASGTDARIFAAGVLNLSGGVYLSVGSAIMSPQIFEKAFSLANNLLLGEGKPAIHEHMIAVVDLQAGGDWDWSAGEPPKTHPAYYLRFCKSFYRMGGELRYVQADNRLVLANLLHRLRGL